jgi:hypothetical protein
MKENYCPGSRKKKKNRDTTEISSEILGLNVVIASAGRPSFLDVMLAISRFEEGHRLSRDFKFRVFGKPPHQCKLINFATGKLFKFGKDIQKGLIIVEIDKEKRKGKRLLRGRSRSSLEAMRKNPFSETGLPMQAA